MVNFYKKDGTLRKKTKVKVIDAETIQIEYCGQIIRFKEFSSDLDIQILDYIKKNTNE
jgi:hypothetical protein